LERFDSNLELAIAGYNAGENAVENSVTEFRRSTKRKITFASFCNSTRSSPPVYPATSDQLCFRSAVRPDPAAPGSRGGIAKIPKRR
jgi:hypothetical protein